MKVEAMRGDFAAVVTDIDIRAPLSDARITDVISAIDRYAVLVFRGHDLLSNDEHLAFAAQFGTLDTSLKVQLKDRATLGRALPEQLFDVSNVDKSGAVSMRDDPRTQSNVGAQVWHTDGAYRHHPYRYSLLAAEILPSWGGNTEFADLRAAFDALDEDLRRQVDGRSAEHDFFFWLCDTLGFPPPSEEERALNPPVAWPLVRVHPGSGRKLLWIETAVSRISGLSVPEGRALARDLLEHATAPCRVYSHEWQVGDVVMWDNRAVLHRGRRFDLSERRQLQRATTIGDDASLGVSCEALMA